MLETSSTKGQTVVAQRRLQVTNHADLRTLVMARLLRRAPGSRSMKAGTEGNRAFVLVAAAAYNAVWGAIAVFAPRGLARFMGFDGRGETIGWRATGVMVLAYSPAYVWAARHPEAARPIVATALFGKSLGAVGWLAGWMTGRFRTRTALLTLLNDAIWLPGLASIIRARSSRRSSGCSGRGARRAATVGAASSEQRRLDPLAERGDHCDEQRRAPVELRLA